MNSLCICICSDKRKHKNFRQVRKTNIDINVRLILSPISRAYAYAYDGLVITRQKRCSFKFLSLRMKSTIPKVMKQDFPMVMFIILYNKHGSNF